MWNEPHYAQTHVVGNGDTAIIEAKWDYPGKYLFHVHGIQEERGSMAIIEVLEDDSTLVDLQTPSNNDGSVSMIKWQEDLIKSLEKPKLISYDNLGDTSAITSELVPTNEVSVVYESWNPEIVESYAPIAIVAEPGTTVSWTNDDTVVHTVTDKEGSFDSGIFMSGTTFEYTFEIPGVYNYYCFVHPWMEGIVKVR